MVKAVIIHGSGIARVLRLPGQMVGMATCYYKVNFDLGFEYLGLICC